MDKLGNYIQIFLSSLFLKVVIDKSRKSPVISQDNSFHDFAALYEKLLFRKLVLGFGSVSLVLLLLKQ